MTDNDEVADINATYRISSRAFYNRARNLDNALDMRFYHVVVGKLHRGGASCRRFP